MPRKAARRAAAHLSSTTTTNLSISGCNVGFPHSLSYEQTQDSISINVPNKGCITINKCADAFTGTKTKSTAESQNFRQDCQALKGLSVQLLNPKSLDNEGQLLSKAVLKLYSMELPQMSFAANTGKESPFLEKCVTSGKYCTLLLKGGAPSDFEVLAALSYQILPPDTQYAEIPLAAVSKEYQRKGLGSFLFNEMQRRLQDVGVLTIFCWGDQESESFWLKQGFVKVAEVDGHGKPRKLPIKPDVRRAMSIPGSATLLVSHLFSKPTFNVSNESKIAATPPRQVQSHVGDSIHETASHLLKPSPVVAITTPTIGELKTSFQITPSPAINGQLVKASSMMPLNMDDVFSSVATHNDELKRATSSTKNAVWMMEPELSLTLAPKSQRILTTGVHQHELLSEGAQHELAELVIPNQEGKAAKKGAKISLEVDKENAHVKSSQEGSGRKRGRPSASQVHRLEKQNKVPDLSQRIKRQDSQPMISQHKMLMEETNTFLTEVRTEPFKEAHVESDMDICCDMNVLSSQLSSPTVMFMNMADDSRRLQLTKFVERLGGKVTNDGNQCTHVVTGEARRTSNFCNALNAGAWVVSPAWLKASVKEKKFVEEAPFILKDAVFENKYKTTLEDVIQRRKQRRHGLLQGMHIYPTKRVQPPVETLSAIIVSAEGKVLDSLEEAERCGGAIVVACEDDISEALLAAKAGLPTYSSEWLMGCIMKQELDMTTSQFAESL